MKLRDVIDALRFEYELDDDVGLEDILDSLACAGMPAASECYFLRLMEGVPPGPDRDRLVAENRRILWDYVHPGVAQEVAA